MSVYSTAEKTRIGEATHGKKRGKPIYRYAILRDGELFGFVEQHEVMRSRMAGRLRVRDFWPLRWSWYRVGEYALRATSLSMEQAVRQLIESAKEDAT